MSNPRETDHESNTDVNVDDLLSPLPREGRYKGAFAQSTTTISSSVASGIDSFLLESSSLTDAA